MTVGRLCRTIRYLRPSQLVWRAWYRLRSPLFHWIWRVGSENTAPGFSPPVAWLGDPAQGVRIIKDGRLRLIGLDGEADDWRASGKPLLWRFTLHYFEWLADLAALGEMGRAPARRLVADWIARHERFDSVAWHPYPLSLRLFAWLAYAPFLLAKADADFTKAFCQSLHRQARHLRRVWELDVGGNHLIKNLKAAITAAICLPGHEDGLLKALETLEKEIGRQVLPDGCHYERSPSYHLQVLSDFEELIALFRAAGRPIPIVLDEAVGRMRPVAAFFRMGSGLLAQFNDGTSDAYSIGTEIEQPPSALPAAGYWRLEKDGLVAVVDCGPCCPDDLPAHAHADTLSFEFSAGRCHVVVNRGTYAYQDAAWRNVLRGTPAHSTVSLDGGNSAEVYGIFRLGRRPSRFDVRVDGREFEGTFDGWRRQGFEHRRCLSLAEGGLTGGDVLTRRGSGQDASATAWFHLHPSVKAQMESGQVALVLSDGSTWRFLATGGLVALEEGHWSPRFYEMEAAHSIRVDWRAGDGDTAIEWRFEPVSRTL